MAKRIPYVPPRETLSIPQSLGGEQSLFVPYAPKPRILADENVEPYVVESFRDAGFDATTVYDKSIAGAKDPQVFERAARTANVLLSHDKGFAPSTDIFNSYAQNIGVVLLPGARNDHGYAHTISLIVDHCTTTLPKLMPSWRGQVVRYYKNGEVVITTHDPSSPSAVGASRVFRYD